MPTIIDGTSGVTFPAGGVGNPASAVVGLTDTQTLTNKTLTSPTIATPTMTGQATIPTINLTGGQITFPATQSASSDANTLDDYEEGTWTPSIGGSTTYITQNAYYTKCGNVVTITGSMKINSQAGNANTYQITSLPFTAKTMTVAKAGCGVVGVTAGLAISVISLQTYVEPNTTNMVFTYSSSASTSNATAIIFGNNADVSFTTTYLTA